MQSLHLTALQLDLAWENPEANRHKIEDMLRQANPATDLILLPEMFTTGFTMRSAACAEPMDGPTTLWMRQLAAQYETLVVGSVIIEEAGHYYNRLIAMSAGGVLATYDKRHLFRMGAENDHYTGGTARAVFSWRGWKICPQICYDLRFPVFIRNGANEVGEMDYDLLLFVANWPQRRAAHWEILAQARAIENQAFVAALNRVGTDGNGLPYSGNSMIVDYMGAQLAYDAGREAVLTASLDPQGLMEWRKQFPLWKDADAFSLQERTHSH